MIQHSIIIKEGYSTFVLHKTIYSRFLIVHLFTRITVQQKSYSRMTLFKWILLYLLYCMINLFIYFLNIYFIYFLFTYLLVCRVGVGRDRSGWQRGRWWARRRTRRWCSGCRGPASQWWRPGWRWSQSGSTPTLYSAQTPRVHSAICTLP